MSILWEVVHNDVQAHLQKETGESKLLLHLDIGDVFISTIVAGMLNNRPLLSKQLLWQHPESLFH